MNHLSASNPDSQNPHGENNPISSPTEPKVKPHLCDGVLESGLDCDKSVEICVLSSGPGDGCPSSSVVSSHHPGSSSELDFTYRGINMASLSLPRTIPWRLPLARLQLRSVVPPLRRWFEQVGCLQSTQHRPHCSRESLCPCRLGRPVHPLHH